MVAARWDYEATDGTPDSVLAQSNQPFAWICGVCGHKWSAAPGQRLSKYRRGCPKCGEQAKTRKTKQPTFADCQDPQGKALLAEWDHERNTSRGNFPHNITLKSHKQIFGSAPSVQQGSSTAGPYHRTSSSQSGCPFCAGHAACKCNCLQALNPDTAAEWDHAKNKGQPSDYTASSHHSDSWFSPERGSWQQPIYIRTDHRLKRSQ